MSECHKKAIQVELVKTKRTGLSFTITCNEMPGHRIMDMHLEVMKKA